MLSFGRILVSDLVTDLFMHSLPGMNLLYLAALCFTPKVFLHEIIYTYTKCNIEINKLAFKTKILNKKGLGIDHCYKK